MISRPEEFIPADFLERIRIAHAKDREAMSRASDQEPAEVAEMVEVHRWA